MVKREQKQDKKQEQNLQEASRLHQEAVKPLVFLGTGDFSDVVRGFTEREVVGYAVNRDYLKEKSYQGLPVVEIETLEDSFLPSDVDLVLAFSARRMADRKAEVFENLVARGYSFANIIHPSAVVEGELGKGNILGPLTVVEKHCRLGSGQYAWHGAILSHHNAGDFNTLGPRATLAGYAAMGSHCFGRWGGLENRVALRGLCVCGSRLCDARSGIS